MHSAQLALFAAFSLLCSAAPLAARGGALTFRAFNNKPISAGTIDNAQAEAEAEAIWPAELDLTDLTAIYAGDLDILKAEREDAEGGAFNPTADNLRCRKIKNKVLKLTGLSQIRQVRLAQAQAAGEDTTDIEAKLLEEDTKLANNIVIGKAGTGQGYTAVDFIGKTGV